MSRLSCKEVWCINQAKVASGFIDYDQSIADFYLHPGIVVELSKSGHQEDVVKYFDKWANHKLKDRHMRKLESIALELAGIK